MKIFLLILLFPFCCFGTNYYVSNLGSDASAGTSAGASWATIAKVNAAMPTMLAGDSILFKRGNTFYGSLAVGRSGINSAHMVYGAYGFGAKPIINGFSNPLSGWINATNGLYENTLTAYPKHYMSMVLVNGALQAMGRYPKAGLGEGSYYTVSSFTTSNTRWQYSNGTVTSTGISSIPSFMGGEMVFKPLQYIYDRTTVLGQTSTVISYAARAFTDNMITSYQPTVNNGFFFQNHPNACTQIKEWAYDSALHKMTMFFGTNTPSPYSVQVAQADTLISIINKSYIDFVNLDVRGANEHLVAMDITSHISFDSCCFSYAGINGIHIDPDDFSQSNYTSVTKCVFNNILNDAINAFQSVNWYIANCYIKNIGKIAGMGLSGDGMYIGVYRVGNNSTVEYNDVDSIGYSGIWFGGTADTIRYNHIRNYLLVKSDGGGIYTYGVSGRNRYVYKNVCHDGIGDSYGLNIDHTNPHNGQGHGIYLDTNTDSVLVAFNLCFNNSHSGIWIGSGTKDTLRNNTCYHNTNAQIKAVDWEGTLAGIVIKNNVLFARDSGEVLISLIVSPTSFSGIVSDSNYLCRPMWEPTNINGVAGYTAVPFRWPTYTDGGSIEGKGFRFWSLNKWQDSTGLELHSQKTYTTIADSNLISLSYATARGLNTTVRGDKHDYKGLLFSGVVSLQPFSGVPLLGATSPVDRYSSIINGAGFPVTITAGGYPNVIGTPNNTTFSYTLDTSSITSAAVYNSDSVLVRTLWSNERQAIGAHTATWDGMDDTLHTVSNGNYRIKVLTNNVNYAWQGVVGNTSDSMTGSTVNHAFPGPPRSLTFVWDKAVYPVGYNEAQPAIFMADSNKVNQKKYLYSAGNSGSISFAAADDSVVYIPTQDSYGSISPPTKVNFIWAIRRALTQKVFASGTPIPMNLGYTYASGIDSSYNPLSETTGFAVQRNGNFIFNAQYGLNRIRVTNKNTGAVVQTIAIYRPRGLAVDGLGHLWVCKSDTAEKYDINAGTGAITTTGVRINGLGANPLAVSVSQNDYNVAIAFGDSISQVRFYRNTDLHALFSVGRLKGYKYNTTVENDRFAFFSSFFGNSGEATSVSFKGDGTFWIWDQGNFRNMHYDSTGTYLGMIMNLGASYHVSVDNNSQTNIYSDFLHFVLDTTKTLGPANASWVLKRNFGYPVSTSLPLIVKNINTLSNGRVYGLVENTSTHKLRITEFPDTLNMRFTGLETDDQQDIMRPDGSIWALQDSAGFKIGWARKLRTGFDGAGNPTYASSTLIAHVVGYTVKDPLPTVGVSSTDLFAGQTTSGIFPSYSANTDTTKPWHLSGVNPTTGRMMWKTRLSTFAGYQGNFPPNGWFDNGNQVNLYSGGFSQALENNIFVSNHDENYKTLQNNKFNHYTDKGLMVGQFGAVGFDVRNLEAPTGMAGNALTGTFVKDLRGNYVLYHGDESYHGGVHRWYVTRLNTIRSQYVDVALNAPATVPITGTDLMAGLVWNSTTSSGSFGWQYNNTRIFSYNGVYTTDRQSPDISFLTPYTTTTQSDSATRTLSAVQATTNWTLTGKVIYPQNYLEDSSQDNHAYLEVVDNNGLIIARFTRTSRNIVGGQISIRGNGTIIKDSTGTLEAYMVTPRQLTITGNSSNVTITYEGFAPVTVASQDAGANKRFPAKLRVRYVFGGGTVRQFTTALSHFNLLLN